MIFRGSDFPDRVNGGSRAAEILFLQHSAFPTTAPPCLGLQLECHSQRCPREETASFYVLLCWRAALKIWVRLGAMWKLESVRVREQCSSFKTQSGPGIGHSHSFRLWSKELGLCSTATELKEKWGHKCRPIAHASRNRKSCRTAFFFYSSLSVVRFFFNLCILTHAVV